MVEVSVTVSLNEGVFICEISGWGQSQETSHLVTFTEEILNGKLHFLCSVRYLSF